jgi:acyl-CoA thioesterase I
LPLGDSITDGAGSTDSAGYRVPLFKLVVAANQKIKFVGSRSSGPNQVSIDAARGTDKIADRLDVLLGKIVNVAPKALIVVAQVTPIKRNPAPLATYNSKIPALVQKRAASGQHRISVDMSQMPTSSLASDGLHPNDTGYTYMADVWYTAIKSYLPK